MMTALRCPSAEQLVTTGKQSPPLRAAASVGREAFTEVRRRAVLEGCKWDPQVGDIPTLSPFPLVMRRSAWEGMAAQAEQLAIEALAAEEEILQAPETLAQLGLPRPLRRVLASDSPLTPTAGRVMRFDFHLTTDGWRISEVNSDVPGGFTEASHFTELMAQHYPALRPAGNPATAWCTALSHAAGASGIVALLSAPGYMEDHQVIAFLAARLREQGCLPHLAKPDQIRWRQGVAWLDTAWYRGPVDLIVRFYQAEWVARLPARSGWQQFFRGGKTPVVNPAPAIISESKRFPLVWERLATRLPTWRVLLPETRDPRNAPWVRDGAWMLKTALCNNGDTVRIRELLKPRDWAWTRFEVTCSPGRWVAQQRFDSVPVSTPTGLRHVCIGVYTVSGRAAGAYARLSPSPVIDFAASDVALLLEDDD